MHSIYLNSYRVNIFIMVCQFNSWFIKKIEIWNLFTLISARLVGRINTIISFKEPCLHQKPHPNWNLNTHAFCLYLFAIYKWAILCHSNVDNDFMNTGRICRNNTNSVHSSARCYDDKFLQLKRYRWNDEKFF